MFVGVRYKNILETILKLHNESCQHDWYCINFSYIQEENKIASNKSGKPTSGTEKGFWAE